MNAFRLCDGIYEAAYSTIVETDNAGFALSVHHHHGLDHGTLCWLVSLPLWAASRRKRPIAEPACLAADRRGTKNHWMYRFEALIRWFGANCHAKFAETWHDAVLSGHGPDHHAAESGILALTTLS